MSLDTLDLSNAPFGDDYSETKNFHEILFRPSVAVQARELNQLQTILQTQIARFGNHLFKDGTILTGCNFTFDPNYTYIKISDLQVDGQPVNVSQYANLYLQSSSSNLTALIVNQTAGLESQNPDLSTLYVKYLNSGTGGEKTYANTEVISVYGKHANGAMDTSNTVAQVKVANSSFTAPVGVGYAMTIGDGYCFQKGYFLRVASQTVIVDAFSNSPDALAVGFETAEELIDEHIDTSLLDNAAGTDNENAPGAMRLKLTPNLVVVPTANVSNTFMSLVQFENGKAVKQKQSTDYNEIGREMATRTYDESGNYVVRPFKITSAPITGNTTHLNINVGAGKAYIDGFKVEQFDTRSVPVEKGTDSRFKQNQSLTTNFGNYVLVKEFLGYQAFNQAITVNLRDTAGARITGETFSVSSPGNVIGTAKVRSIVHESGVPGTPEAEYRMYLFDVQMNAGKNFANVLSVQSSTGIADIVQEAGQSFLYETDFNTLVFSFGQKAIKTLYDLGGNTDTSFMYRTQTSAASFNANGVLSITVPSGFTFPYTAGSTLNDTQEDDIMIVMLTNVNSVNLGGTVAITSGSNVVSGSGTTFVSDLAVGDYISALGAAGVSKRITAVINNTSLQVASNYAVTNASCNYARAYVNNVPVKMASIGGASANVDGTGQILTIKLPQALASSANAEIVYNVTKNQAIQLGKTITKNAYVKLDLSTNAGGITGPWSLGLPDVAELVGVYVANSYSGIEANANDKTSQFVLDTGQTENNYGLAKLKLAPGATISLSTANKILVKFNVFQSDSSTGKGFYSVDSYPIDDATVPTPSNKIRTEEIPVFVSSTGVAYDLRNSMDFRPYCSNTATVTTSSGSATENPSATETYAATEKYFPVPNETVTTDLQYYLGRIDAIVMDSFGNLRDVQGIASENPAHPGKVTAAMLLAYATIPPYPSLSIPEASAVSRPDYAVKFRLSQNKRYTMEEIGGLDKRINNLEYYTSLSLLEKNTKDLVIPSSIDGSLDRFKNGILVDPFNDFTIANLQSPEFVAGIDPTASELIPTFKQQKFDLEVANTANVTITGDSVTLPYTHVAAFTQPYASKLRSLTDQYYRYSGTAKIMPPYDNFYEVRTSPQTISVDNSTAILDLIDNLNNILPLTRTVTSQSSVTTETQIANTAQSQTFEDVTTTTTTSTTTGLSGTPTVHNTPVGDFVTDIRFMPYIREQVVYVYAYGLRPLTRVYPFFDGVDVSAYCTPATVAFSESIIAEENFAATGAAGDAITTSSTGEVYFIFHIPSSTFLVGERELTLLDIASLASLDSATTVAFAKFNAYNFSVDKESLALSTRNADVNISALTSSSTTTTRTTVTRPVSQPIPTPAANGGISTIGADRINVRFLMESDPLSQTFFVDPALCDGLEGMFVTKVDVYFQKKSLVHGVTAEIRVVQNGYPTNQTIPFSRKHLKSSDVSVSDTASIATTFTFDAPVFLKAGFEYALVLTPDATNPDYLAWVSQIGGTDVLNPSVAITQDWGSGSLFMSHNNTTWTALQNEDLKFTLYRANFSSSSGSVTLQNKAYEFLTIQGASNTFQHGERLTKIGANATGNVALSSSNTTVVGTGTSFLSTVVANSWIAFVSGTDYDVKKVKSVTNNTSLVLYSAPKFTNTAAKYQTTVTGRVFYNEGNELILEDSTANSTVKFAATDILYAPLSNVTANIVSVDNQAISYFQPLLPKTSVQGTTISIVGTTTANNGTQTSGQAFEFGSTAYLSNETVIMSRSNEVTTLTGGKSFKLEIDLSSDYGLTSPFVDVKSASVLYYKNIINNDETNEYTSSGNAQCRWITKTVNLAENQESEDIKVLVTAYRPSDTDVSVYAKILSEFDNESFDTKNWVKLTKTNELYSDSANRQDFVELEYTFPDEPAVTALTGVVATTNGSANVDGVGTDFVSNVTVGQCVSINNGANSFVSSVLSITNTSQVILNSPVPFSNTSTTISILNENHTAFRNDQNSGIISYINGAGAEFNGYKTFALKIILKAASGNKYPRLKDARSIAMTI